MAKLKIQTETLESQSQRLLALSEEIQGIYTQAKGAVNLINSSMSAKFSPNMSTKTRGMLQQLLNTKNQLSIAGAIAHKCVVEYQNADKVIRKYIVGLSDETINTPVSSQTVQRYNQEELNSVKIPKQTADKCTSCALTALINRRFVVDGRDPSITFNDVRTNYQGGNGFYRHENPTEKIPYEMCEVKKSSINGSIENYIKKMLDEHPEGIEFYGNYTKSNGKSSKHAIVITRYEVMSDGSVQFYALDSSSSTLSETRLEDSYMGKKFNGNIDNMFNKMDALFYLQ